jgi:pimeloyl-ACP methyl ester carboxylesterase
LACSSSSAASIARAAERKNNFAVFSQAQAFFRAKQPPTLIMWGEHDPLFLPAAAHAYAADLPGAQIQMLDAGHFALEDHVDEVATSMHQFADETPSLQIAARP